MCPSGGESSGECESGEKTEVRGHVSRVTRSHLESRLTKVTTLAGPVGLEEVKERFPCDSRGNEDESRGRPLGRQKN